MPGFWHHPRAHDRWRGLHADTPLVVLGQYLATLEGVAPAQSQTRRDRIEQATGARVVIHRSLAIGALGQNPMGVDQLATLRVGLGAQGLLLLGVEGQLGQVTSGDRLLRWINHGRESGSSRFRTA